MNKMNWTGGLFNAEKTVMCSLYCVYLKRLETIYFMAVNMPVAR